MSVIGEKVVAAIREVAEAAPDYVYRGDCQYVRADLRYVPDCIVGHGLWAAGLINEAWLESRDNAHHNTVNILALSTYEAGWDFDPYEIEWLTSIQDEQDTGKTSWGKAVKWADEMHPLPAPSLVEKDDT